MSALVDVSGAAWGQKPRESAQLWEPALAFRSPPLKTSLIKTLPQ